MTVLETLQTYWCLRGLEAIVLGVLLVATIWTWWDDRNLRLENQRLTEELLDTQAALDVTRAVLDVFNHPVNTASPDSEQ